MPYLRISGQPMAEDVLQHIEHALNVCGEDHVGIGTDGSISAVTVTPEYRQAYRAQIAERRKLGVAAPGDRRTFFCLSQI
jgi:membrane dipeptidase